MKTNGHKPDALTGGNLFHVKQQLKAAKLNPGDFGLLLLIADMLDDIASGRTQNMYVGHTKNRSAFAVYVNGDAETGGIYGTTLDDLNVAALDFVSDAL